MRNSEDMIDRHDWSSFSAVQPWENLLAAFAVFSAKHFIFYLTVSFFQPIVQANLPTISPWLNSQLVSLLPVGIFNYVKFIWNMFPLLQWHACKLDKLSACIAKCTTTINVKIYIFLHQALTSEVSMQVLRFWQLSWTKRGLRVREINPPT